MVYNDPINKTRRYFIMAYVISDECVACGACSEECASVCPVGAPSVE